MKRSGHHALAMWLAGHFPENVLHLNDVRPFSDPFKAASGHSPIHQLRGSRDLLHCGNDAARAAAKKCLLLSYEDLDLSLLDGRRLVPDADQWLGHSEHRIHLVCLRDPYNMLASRFELWPSEVRQKHQSILACWIAHAREFLGQSNSLCSKIPVNFNSWFADRVYRQELSTGLGLPFTDQGFRVIPPALIGGSSFNRACTAARPEDLDVLNRWRRFKDNPEFLGFFEREDCLHALAETIFGPVLAGDS